MKSKRHTLLKLASTALAVGLFLVQAAGGDGKPEDGKIRPAPAESSFTTGNGTMEKITPGLSASDTQALFGPMSLPRPKPAPQSAA